MNNGNLNPGYETVFTVTDYLDHPRKGIANYQGKPHLYERLPDEQNDHGSELFQLTPLDSITFELAMEDWEIWRRWLVAFYEKKTDISTRPALPSEAGRHAELKQILDEVLVSDPQKATMRVGRFEVLEEPSIPERVIRQLQVKWIQPA
jgi:hypothetical protein